MTEEYHEKSCPNHPPHTILAPAGRRNVATGEAMLL
jgi:hypothetical protein